MGVNVRGGAESSIQWAQAAGVDQEQHPIGLYVGGGPRVSESRVKNRCIRWSNIRSAGQAQGGGCFLGWVKASGLHSLSQGSLSQDFPLLV